MVKAAPDSFLFATRHALAASLCAAMLALAGCGPDRNLSEQVAQANAAAARAESARKAAEPAPERLNTQPPPAAPAEEQPVIDGDDDTATHDAPMDTTEPALDPEPDSSE